MKQEPQGPPPLCSLSLLWWGWCWRRSLSDWRTPYGSVSLPRPVASGFYHLTLSMGYPPPHGVSFWPWVSQWVSRWVSRWVSLPYSPLLRRGSFCPIARQPPSRGPSRASCASCVRRPVEGGLGRVPQGASRAPPRQAPPLLSQAYCSPLTLRALTR